MTESNGYQSCARCVHLESYVTDLETCFECCCDKVNLLDFTDEPCKHNDCKHFKSKRFDDKEKRNGDDLS
jgi:hypothetical protein